jgi:transposase
MSASIWRALSLMCDGLAARVQTVLCLDPHGGALFVFRGRRGNRAT